MFERKRTLSLNDQLVSNTISATLNCERTFITGNITSDFNNSLSQSLKRLNSLRNDYQIKVNGLDCNDFSMRSKGVSLAWDYEKTELEMGGKGTREWTVEQRDEIVRNGKLRGAEGHHINNVKDHPTEQANPDNIKFAKDRQEHQEFHDGNFKNETTGELYNRNSNLEKANFKRVLGNELKGIGMAALIGLGVGVSIGFVCSLAINGCSVEALKEAVMYSGKMGIYSAAMATTNHVVLRLVGERLSNSIVTVLTGNLGLALTGNLIEVINMGVVGWVCIGICTILTFVKLMKQGRTFKQAFKGMIISATLPTIILLISLIAQVKLGGKAGGIVSLISGTIVLGYSVISSIMDSKTSKRISIMCVELTEPCIV
ncbi:hypothetical protein FDB29_08755 [Clostridium botulinum]|nr:hypothetical protein [Clostridium botulinum]